MVQKHRLSAEQHGTYSSYSKTKLFIDELQSLKIFNPLAMVALYSQILSGQKIGEGHKITF